MTAKAMTLSRLKSPLLNYGPSVLLLLTAVAVWEIWVSVRDTPAFILPAPSVIWQALLDNQSLLVGHTYRTVVESAIGLGVGAALALLLAITIAGVPLARRVLYPIIVVSQTIPMIIISPLLVLWFGFGLAPKIVVVALITFFPVAISTASALMGADRELLNLLRSMGAGRTDLLRHVLIPGSVPAFFDGLKIASAYTIAGAVIAEWTGAKEGLGVFIARSQASFRVDQVFAAVAIVALLSTALFASLTILARMASPWRHVD